MRTQATPIVHISIRGGAIESVNCDQEIHVVVTDWDNYNQRAGNMFDVFYSEVVTRRHLADSLRQARTRRARINRELREEKAG